MKTNKYSEKKYFTRVMKNNNWTKTDIQDFRLEMRQVKPKHREKCYAGLIYASQFSGQKTLNDLIHIIKDWSKEL